MERLLARIKAINPAAPLWRSAETPPKAEELLSQDGAAFHHEALPSVPPVHHHAHSHSDIHAFALVFDAPLDWTLFGIWLTMLLNRHGQRILRVKGILNIEGNATPVAIHGVQHLVHPPVHLRAWPDAARQSRLVFIVKGLEQDRIAQSLRAFGLGDALAAVPAV